MAAWLAKESLIEDEILKNVHMQFGPWLPVYHQIVQSLIMPN